ncbi:flagellar hook-associated family protein [Breoghania sp.]
MKTTFVSTYALSNSTRNILLKQASDISKLTTEMSTGRKADVGLDLGAGTAEVVTLRSEYYRLNAIMDTNALVSSRLDVTQAALDDVLSNAEEFMATLVGISGNSGGAKVSQSEAQAGLELMVARLNTQLNGSYLFAGLNTDAAPMESYYGTPPGASKAAVDAAFFAEFGMTQDDPAVASISPTAMETFLTGAYANLFGDPDWGNDWSSASDQVIRSRISTSELAETSVSANEDAFRKLMSAYTMVADLGAASLNEETYDAVVVKATEMLGEAISGVTDLMAKMGTAQQRVSNASERLSIQTDILNHRIVELENVDPTETSARLESALTQMEISYAVTARISQLSLINYL